MTAFLAGEAPIILEGLSAMMPHIQAGMASHSRLGARTPPAAAGYATDGGGRCRGLRDDDLVWRDRARRHSGGDARRLSREIAAITENAAGVAQIIRMGGQVWTGGAARFAALIASDEERWAPAVKAAGTTRT
jgi:tripartite-type tricarboxylate transporter receptor subunit TctC